jgi:hypothetical protein
LLPAAKHVVVVGQLTPRRSAAGPLDDWLLQLAPFVVTATAPPIPTAKHVVVLGQLTARSCGTVTVWAAHVTPPFVEPYVASPTAKQMEVDGQLTPYMLVE